MLVACFNYFGFDYFGVGFDTRGGTAWFWLTVLRRRQLDKIQNANLIRQHNSRPLVILSHMRNQTLLREKLWNIHILKQLLHTRQWHRFHNLLRNIDEFSSASWCWAGWPCWFCSRFATLEIDDLNPFASSSAWKSSLNTYLITSWKASRAEINNLQNENLVIKKCKQKYFESARWYSHFSWRSLETLAYWAGKIKQEGLGRSGRSRARTSSHKFLQTHWICVPQKNSR